MSIFKRDQAVPAKQPAQYVEKQSVAPRPESSDKVNPSPTATPAPEPTAASPAPSSAPPVNREAAAILDRNTDLTGTLHSKRNVLVEGCFQGEIEAKETIWVEQGARTQGQLRSNDAVISGSFDGQVECQHRLQITQSAAVSGEIKTPVLIVEEGATINCRFSMARPGR
jgi:cytoskeletal protein CcmA (bactofilin family)